MKKTAFLKIVKSSRYLLLNNNNNNSNNNNNNNRFPGVVASVIQVIVVNFNSRFDNIKYT